jgi:beta-glucosidase
MPTYTIPRELVLDGAPVEAVGGGFNRHLIEGLLRGTHRFDGFVLSDWAIYLDATTQTFEPTRPQSPRDIAMPWGVESLTRAQRFAKSVAAGVDQLGGEEDVATLIAAVEERLIPLARIDEAVFRLLVVKFRQGLFDAPFVDAQAAAERVGSDAAVSAGRDAQRRSLVCLKKPTALRGGVRMHLAHFDIDGAPIDAADAAVIRLSAPHQPLHPNHFFGRLQQEGDIDYKEESDELIEVRSLAARLPTTAVIQMSRPTIVANLLPLLDGLYVDFGVADDILLDVLTGADEPDATLPFELPSSMDAVRGQRADLPCDSDAPTFRCGTNYRSR